MAGPTYLVQTFGLYRNPLGCQRVPRECRLHDAALPADSSQALLPFYARWLKRGNDEGSVTS